MGIYRETVEMLRELYGIPEEYEVMFVQGGGHLQFAMIPLNFAVGGIGNYAVDGVWSRKAFNEAQKIGEAAEVACTELRAPRQDELAVTDGAAICITAPTKRSTAFVTGIARKSMFP